MRVVMLGNEEFKVWGVRQGLHLELRRIDGARQLTDAEAERLRQGAEKMLTGKP